MPALGSIWKRRKNKQREETEKSLALSEEGGADGTDGSDSTIAALGNIYGSEWKTSKQKKQKNSRSVK